MIRGRRPRPTKIKELEGEFPYRLNKHEATPPAEGQPPAAPKGASKDVLEFYKKYAPMLHKMGLLTTLDYPAFELMAETWDLYRETLRVIELRGTTMADGKVAPEVYVRDSAQRDLVRQLASFGMTPDMRARLGL